MDEDEILIEDDSIALDDSEDSTAEDVGISSIIDFIEERYTKAED